jgi:glycosyltransferase involved in cell wall biosynthesis
MSRVLLVGKGPPDRGGISTFMQTLLASELSRDHQLALCNLYHDEVWRGGQLNAANIRRTLKDISAVWRQSQGFDIVHIHSFLLPPAVTMIRAGLLALTARLRGCRVAIHVHSGIAGSWLTTKSRRLLTRFVLASVDRLMVVTAANQRALQSALGKDRVVLVDNGIDASRYGPPEEAHDPPRILFVGVLSPRKGAVDLLQSSRRLLERGVHHELLIAGGPPEHGPQEELAVRNAAGPQVRFLGAQPHAAMPALYRGADVFCLPSWGEGMPLSILEAMASGLPVVATPVGDVARAVVDRVTGRLVPVRDPQALADALESLLRDPGARRGMGTTGRRRVDDLFSLERMCRAIDDQYGQLASPRVDGAALREPDRAEAG